MAPPTTINGTDSGQTPGQTADGRKDIGNFDWRARIRPKRGGEDQAYGTKNHKGEDQSSILSPLKERGLDMDYEGNPFGPIPNLMACAEEVKKVYAVCVETGNPAGYSYRKEEMKELVLIGEKKEYEPLSREVFIKRMNKRKF